MEEKLIAQLEKNGKSALIIRGKPDEDLLPAPIGNITFVNHLSADIMQYHLLHSIYIVCRSGYSSLMDLAAVGKSAIIIPTPGQTEQEYLADYHHLRGHHFRALQEDLDLQSAFEGLTGCKSLLLENKKLATVLKNIFL